DGLRNRVSGERFELAHLCGRERLDCARRATAADGAIVVHGYATGGYAGGGADDGSRSGGRAADFRYRSRDERGTGGVSRGAAERGGFRRAHRGGGRTSAARRGRRRTSGRGMKLTR